MTVDELMAEVEKVLRIKEAEAARGPATHERTEDGA